MVTEIPESIGLDRKLSVERDRIDLNHEIAGVDSGRMQRFLLENALFPRSENSEKKKSERAMTMLRYLLENDAQYAKRYFEVAEKLDEAQQAVGGALSDIAQRTAVSDRELQNLRDNSAKREDGTSVFRSSDGSIYTQGGQRLSDEDAQEVDIPDGAPSWEEYKAAQERRAALLRDRQEIERYEREVLKPAQDRMQDQDNPMSQDELDKLESDAEHEKPAALNQYGNNSDRKASIELGSVAAEISAENAKPKEQELSLGFNDASFDLTDDLDAPMPQPPSGKPAQAITL